MVNEGTTAPAGDGQVEGGADAPDMSVWNDTTRDAILSKYGNDTNSLAKGYWNSQQAFDKQGVDAASISTERADFVQQRQEWEAERLAATAALEKAMESETTAADINKSVWDAVQDDLVANNGEITDKTRESMMKIFNDDKAFVERTLKIAVAEQNERFTAAQEFAPQGTDVKELLNFFNKDVTNPEGTTFSAEEAAYFIARADKGDYGFVAQVEEKYLASLKEGEKPTKAAKVPAHSNRGPSRNSQDSFSNQEEYDAAKKDPKFHADYEYRLEVERKYRNSDVEAMANAKMEAHFGPNWDTRSNAVRNG